MGLGSLCSKVVGQRQFANPSHPSGYWLLICCPTLSHMQVTYVGLGIATMVLL